MKFLIKDIKEEKNWNVITVEPEGNKMCKNCGSKSRRNGSATCQDCADLWNQNKNN